MFFFFNDTATTEIYTLSLHDALPISNGVPPGYDTDWIGVEWILRSMGLMLVAIVAALIALVFWLIHRDRKSTRLNSSHANISYAVFCLKKKQQNVQDDTYATDIYTL